MQKNIDKLAVEYIIKRGWAVIPGVLTLDKNNEKQVNVKSDYW